MSSTASEMAPVWMHPHAMGLRVLVGPKASACASHVEWENAAIIGGDCSISPNIYLIYIKPEAPVITFYPDGTYTHGEDKGIWKFRLFLSSCADKQDAIFKATRVLDVQGTEAIRWKLFQNLLKVVEDSRTWVQEHALPEAPDGVLDPVGNVWHFYENGGHGLSSLTRFPKATPNEALYKMLRKHERLTNRAQNWLLMANGVLRTAMLRHLPPARELLPGSKALLTINGRDYWVKTTFDQEMGNYVVVWEPLEWNTTTLKINLDGETP